MDELIYETLVRLNAECARLAERLVVVEARLSKLDSTDTLAGGDDVYTPSAGQSARSIAIHTAKRKKLLGQLK